MCGPILMAALGGCGGGGSNPPAPFAAPVSSVAPANCAAGGIAVNAAVITICSYLANDTYTASSSNPGMTLVRSSPTTFTVVGTGISTITIAWTNGIDTDSSTFTVCENESGCASI
jgi:hypothetical protein